MADPIGVAVAWVGTTLEGDPTLMSYLADGVHDGELPEGAGYPALVISEKRNTPTTTLSGTIVLYRVNLTLAATDRETESSTTVEQITDRCVALLHQQRGESFGSLVYGCVLVETEELAITIDDVPYRSELCRFRIDVGAGP